MKLTLRIPERGFMGWIAYIAVAVTVYAYCTLTSISMITYILIGGVMMFSMMNGTLGKIVSTRYFYYSALLVVYILLVVLLGPPVHNAMPRAIVYQMLVCLSIYVYIMADGKGINGIMFLMSVSVLILCFTILTDDNLMHTLQNAGEEGIFYTLGENNRNTIGILLSLGALCMMHLGLDKNRIWFVGMVLAIGLGLTTGSRKVVLTVMAGAILYVYLYTTYYQKKTATKKQKTLFFVLLAVVAMLYACFEVPALYNIIGIRIEGFLAVLTGEGEKEASAEIRAEMVQRALEMFAEKPILGWGIEGFAMKSGFGVYSHNNYTETLVSFGLVGFVLLYSVKLNLVVNQFKLMVREKRVNRIPQHCIVFVLLLAALMLDFTAISMNNVVMNMPFAMAAASRYYDMSDRMGYR